MANKSITKVECQDCDKTVWKSTHEAERSWFFVCNACDQKAWEMVLRGELLP